MRCVCKDTRHGLILSKKCLISLTSKPRQACNLAALKMLAVIGTGPRLCNHVMYLGMTGHNDGYYWCRSSPVMGACLMLSGLIFSFSWLSGEGLVNLGLLFHHVCALFTTHKRDTAESRHSEGRGQDLLPLPLPIHPTTHHYPFNMWDH